MAGFGFQGLSAAFEAIDDVRPHKLPFLPDVTVFVRRLDSPEWAKWQKANTKKSPLNQALGRVMLAEGVRGALNKGSVDGIIERSIEKVEIDFSSASARDLNTLKLGAAQHLIDSWSGVRDAETGEDLPCDLETCLEFLGWEGVAVTWEGKTPKFYTVSEWEALKEKSAPKKAIANGKAVMRRFEAEGLKDDQGRYLFLPVDYDEVEFEYEVEGDDGETETKTDTRKEQRKYTGMLAGDAMISWIIDCSQEGAIAAQKQEAQEADFLPPTPGGEPETSTS